MKKCNYTTNKNNDILCGDSLYAENVTNPKFIIECLEADEEGVLPKDFPALFINFGVGLNWESPKSVEVAYTILPKILRNYYTPLAIKRDGNNYTGRIELLESYMDALELINIFGGNHE